MKTLVVIDMQNDFITGSLGTPDAQAIVPKVKAKVEEYVKNGDFILYTRDTHFKNYSHTLEGKKLPIAHCECTTHGWQIPDEILPPADYPYTYTIDKYSFGYDQIGTVVAASTDLLKLDELEIVGLCTDICVVSNALILKSSLPEVEITVDADCCAGVTPETHRAALTVMYCCQINIKNGPLEI